METVEYIELFWDCPQCGQKHISAVFNPQGQRCPQCLHWRSQTVELYEAPDSRVITDPEIINRPPFWVCKVCEAVNEDHGESAHLLQCGNCDNYQVSAVAGISGDAIADQQAPPSVAVGEAVSSQSVQSPATPVRRTKWLGAIAGLMLLGGSAIGYSHWTAQTPALPPPVTVQVSDLQWRSTITIEENQRLTRQGWQDAVPKDAVVLKQETRQRSTRQDQRGVQTVMVNEQYQSGSREETYYVSERYQSGSRQETYYDSERYQSGTEEKCKTVSKGNGVGQRTCQTVPVYSTRQVSRTRTVPVYSTRQVSRSRTVPVYSTRQVPTQQPILVPVPVLDTWVTYTVQEWVPKQTVQRQGNRDAARDFSVPLQQKPPQRIANTQLICQVTGTGSESQGWFLPAVVKTRTWQLPCEQFDRVHVGDRITLQPTTTQTATLVDPR